MIKTAIGFFFFSLILSLALTPVVSRFAFKYKLLDYPSERKVHFSPIPRIGGLGIFISFGCTFIPFLFFNPSMIVDILADQRFFVLSVAICIAFLMGFTDDIFDLNARLKLLIQIGIAFLLYFGGLRINTLGPINLQIAFHGLLSLPVTTIWVILVINAINLIDGLDGLAAGVSFFVCIALIITCINLENAILAFILASLAGAILGFLKYNFTPASIFMGDGGSYFIGALFASISMMGKFSSQTAASILIPMIALGLPLTDVIWATVRRFIVGEDIFAPDKNHIHHKLLGKGFTQEHVVFLLYAMTVFMGVVAVGLVYFSAGEATLIIIALAIALFLFVKKSGLIGFNADFYVNNWLSDILDAFGITQERRKFFGHQIEISKAKNIHELWTKAKDAFGFIGVEYLEMELFAETQGINKKFCWNYLEGMDKITPSYAEDKLYIRFPIEHEDINMGVLIVSKEMFDLPNKSETTFRRLDQLRRTISYSLYELMTG